MANDSDSISPAFLKYSIWEIAQKCAGQAIALLRQIQLSVNRDTAIFRESTVFRVAKLSLNHYVLAFRSAILLQEIREHVQVIMTIHLHDGFASCNFGVATRALNDASLVSKISSDAKVKGQLQTLRKASKRIQKNRNTSEHLQTIPKAFKNIQKQLKIMTMQK